MTTAVRPTLREVASSSGVSLSTASRVMREDLRVAPETRARVLAAAKSLGFRVNTLASSLRQSGVSRLVGVVLPDVSDPFFSSLAHGFESKATELGRGMVLACHGENAAQERWLLERMIGNRLAALVIVPAATDYGYLAPEMALGTPVVLVDRPGVGIAADTVTTDNRAGIQLLVDALVAAGHRRIALITEDQQIWTQRERIDGYHHGLIAHGLEIDDSLVRSIPSPSADAASAVRALLGHNDPPTAVITTHVPLLITTLEVIRDEGRDLALASFDDHPLFSLLPQPILVARQNPIRMGQCAAELALGRLAGDHSPARRVVMPVEIYRPAARSTAPTAPAGSRAVRGRR